ncbi:hypothetical protein ACUSIJ_17055 [Pseudochelatococcus sp. B33]
MANMGPMKPFHPLRSSASAARRGQFADGRVADLRPCVSPWLLLLELLEEVACGHRSIKSGASTMKPMTAALILGGAGLGMFAGASGTAYVPAGMAIAAGVGAFAWHAMRRRRPPACLPASSCGCASSSTQTNENEAAEEAIACTLQTEDFKSRAVWIRGIAERHLKKFMRSPLTLHLLYEPEAADDMREMVRKEQECCAFLRFDLSVADDAVHLLITAPEAAREAADMLFDHFVPDLEPVEAT